MNDSRVEMMVNRLISHHEDLRKFSAMIPHVEEKFVSSIAQINLRLALDLFSDERIAVRGDIVEIT
jgi:hypothetical protein